MSLYTYTTSGTTTTSHGYADSQVSDPMDVDDIELGTKTTTIVDESGNLLQRYVQRCDPAVNSGAWFVTSLQKTTDQDDFGRPTAAAYYFGAEAAAEVATPTSGTALYTTQTAYACCGVSQATDPRGLVTTYEYDSLGRLIETTRVVGTSGEMLTVTTYDAAGRAIETESGPDTNNLITVSQQTYDLAGRIVKTTDAAGKSMFYTYQKVLPDGTTYDPQTDTPPFYEESRVYPHNQASGPIQVSWSDGHGRTVRAFAAKLDTGETDWNGAAPAGDEALVELSRAAYTYDWAGRQLKTRTYHNLSGLAFDAEGTLGTNYYESESLAFDALGRLLRSMDTMGNIAATVYDSDGRAIEYWMGTDDTDATPDDPTGDGATGNDMVMVSKTFYDTDRDGTGDPRPYATRVYQVKAIDTTPSAANLSTDYAYTDYDYVPASNDTTTWTKSQTGPWSKSISDYAGRQLDNLVYQNGSTTTVVAKSQSIYDEANSAPLRLIATRTFNVVSGSATSDYLQTTQFYDDAERVVKTAMPSGGFSKTQFDGYGRTLRSVVAGAEGATNEPDSFTDDIVVSEAVYSYEDVGNVIQVTTYERRHDASTYGGLLSADTSKARVNYAATWYGDAHRPTHTAFYGTNGGSAFSRPSTPIDPDDGSRSDDYIVTMTTYDAAGRASEQMDNDGIVTHTFYDALGRPTYTVENYKSGAAYWVASPYEGPADPKSRANDENRITQYTYNAQSQIIAQTAVDPDANGTLSDNQTTTYIFSSALTDKGSVVKFNSLLRAIIYPDSDDVVTSSALANGTDSTYDRVELNYYANGSIKSRKDQRSIVLTSAYDALGRQTEEKITSGAASGIQQVKYTYDTAARIEKVTSYSTIDTTIDNEVRYAYNGFGQPVTEYQDHDSAVDTTPTTGSHRVEYGYDATVSSNVFTNAHRLAQMKYPNGRLVHHVYDGHNGIDTALSRLNELADDSVGSPGTPGDPIVQYNYLGSNRVVRKALPTPQVRMNYIDATGDPYDVAFDRFGRVTQHTWEWYNPGTGAGTGDIFSVGHAYDRASNRLHADRSDTYPSYSSVYAYDDLHRLDDWDTGEIDSGGTSIKSHWTLNDTAWTLDQLGNHDKVAEQSSTDHIDNGVNKANEITTRLVKGSASKAYLNDVFSADTSANFQEVGSETAAVTGGYLYVGSVTQDTLETVQEPEAAAILLYGEEVGAMRVWAQVEFTSGSTGQAGVIFGYKGPNDYWVLVRDLADGDEKVYHISGGSKTLYASTALAGFATGTAVPASATAKRNTANVIRASSYDFADGFPSGRVGLWTNTANVKFHAIRIFKDAQPQDIAGRWQSFSRIHIDDSGTYADTVRLSADTDNSYDPILLAGVRTPGSSGGGGASGGFEATFSLQRNADGDVGQMRFIFGATDQDDYRALRLRHDDVTAGNAPLGHSVRDGKALAGESHTVRTDANVATGATATTKVWYRITNDGTTLKVYSSASEAGLASASTCYESTDADLVDAEGMIGFVALATVVYVDDFTLNLDLDANGSYETTAHKDDFIIDGSGYAEVIDENDFRGYDAAGNLIWDGVYKYIYDAWNRLVKVEKAYRAPGSPGTLSLGQTTATLQYDGLHRRIVKAISGSADLDCTYHYYYDNQWRIIEERNGSDQVLKQQVWGQMYIDELIQIGVNHDPVNADTGNTLENLCERFFWTMHDANYNVLGIASVTGRLIERYEYTPYGQRTVYSHGWYKADVNDDGAVNGIDQELIGQNATTFLDPKPASIYDLDANGRVNAFDSGVARDNAASTPLNDPVVSYPRAMSFRENSLSTSPMVTPLSDFGHQGLLHLAR